MMFKCMVQFTVFTYLLFQDVSLTCTELWIQEEGNDKISHGGNIH